jgi:hypothetical protein
MWESILTVARRGESDVWRDSLMVCQWDLWCILNRRAHRQNQRPRLKNK